MGAAKVTKIGPLQRYKEWKLSLKINGIYEFESLHSDHFKIPIYIDEFALIPAAFSLENKGIRG
jgi:hypothetical protein